MKRTSHISIILTDDVPAEEPKPKRARSGAKAAAKPAPKKKAEKPVAEEPVAEAEEETAPAAEAEEENA